MALPNPGMNFTPFDQLPASDLNKMVANDEYLEAKKVTNSMLDTTSGELGGAYQTYVPSFTNFTLGDGTVSASYTTVGKTVIYVGRVVLGTTSSMGTQPIISLPVTSIAYTGGVTLGCVYVQDLGTGEYDGLAIWRSTTTSHLWVKSSGGAYVGISNIQSTVPMTWTTGDNFSWSIIYQSA